MFGKTFTSLALAAVPAAAHLSMFHPSMYNFQSQGGARGNGNLPQWPLGYPDYLSFDQWWFHGNMDKPPADGVFFDLPAGGTANTEVACDKRFTSFAGYNDGSNACPNDYNSIHIAGDNDVRGCAIAIAYKSNPRDVKPEDFVVISVNHNCPKARDVTFEIPAGLPECPPEGCHCMWGWVHGQAAGGDEMYQTPFKCKVSNPGTKTINKGKAPVHCDSGDCRGAKNPLYFSMVEGANVQKHNGNPPYYNSEYGWDNGAQNDIFGEGGSNGSTPSQGNNNNGQAPTDNNTEQPAPTDNTAAPAPTDDSTTEDDCDEETSTETPAEETPAEEESAPEPQPTESNSWNGHRGKHGGSSWRGDRWNKNRGGKYRGWRKWNRARCISREYY